MAFWLLLAAAALVAAFLLRPLMAGTARAGSRERAERGRLRDLVSAKEAAFTALKEIEFDYLTRKLDDRDYQTLRARYREQAVQLLREIDILTGARTAGEGDPGR